MDRNTLLAVSLGSAVVAGSSLVYAGEQSNTPSVFYSLTAEQARVTPETLTLSGDLHVMWVTDRPSHEAGATSAAELVLSWQDGEDSFASDPPNAVLTGFSSGERVQAAIELTSSVRKEGEITFTYTMLYGEMLPQIRNVSLFIDEDPGGGQYVYSGEPL